MRIEHQITQGRMKEGIMTFTYEGAAEKLGDRPSGTLITDSDARSFVYLFEDGEDYSYLHFTENVWPLMQQMLEDNQSNPNLECEDQTIELTGFTEELTMLIFNIEGNGNYGESFMLAVEKVFEKTLTATS